MKRSYILFIALTISFSLFSQETVDSVKVADNYPSKEYALNYLSQEKNIDKFGTIAGQIWSFAELGMQEFKSSELLASTLEKEGFKVERGMAGIPTCFVASWGSGHPVIGILGEYDALPMLSQKAGVPTKDPVIEGAPGHGCGHNLMGTAAISAAIAVKRSMEKYNIRGTIKFFGSPAEETLISRPYMVRAGLFKDIDAVIDNHASSVFATGYGVSGSANMSVIFRFSGKTAHSAGAPWSGRSALDAVELMNVSTNFLREHLHISYRLHYVITEGGEAPNVVPDKAAVWYFVRNTDERIEDMFRRVVNCAKAAALATETDLDTVNIITGVHQKHSNKGMAELIYSNILLVRLPSWSQEENNFAISLQKNLGVEQKGMPAEISPLKPPSTVQTGGGSTDVGEVSLIAPTATLNFPGSVPGAIGHHWSLVACNKGTAATKGLIAGGKVMAATAIDLLTKPHVLDAIKKEFVEYSKTHPYKSFLPEDAKPPLDLNLELMKKYRPLMEKAQP